MLQPGQMDRPLDDDPEFFKIYRFGMIIVCAERDSPYRIHFISVSGNHDDLCFILFTDNFLQEP